MQCSVMTGQTSYFRLHASRASYIVLAPRLVHPVREIVKLSALSRVIVSHVQLKIPSVLFS